MGTYKRTPNAGESPSLQTDEHVMHETTHDYVEQSQGNAATQSAIASVSESSDGSLLRLWGFEVGAAELQPVHRLKQGSKVVELGQRSLDFVEADALLASLVDAVEESAVIRSSDLGSLLAPLLLTEVFAFFAKSIIVSACTSC